MPATGCKVGGHEHKEEISRAGPHGELLRCPRDPGPSLGAFLPSLVSSSDKALTSSTRELRDSRICCSISLSPVPTLGEVRMEENLEQLPAGSRGREEMGWGPSTRTCLASSSSSPRAPEASTCLEACRRVACVRLERRLARRRSCLPSLSKALASCGVGSRGGGKGVSRVSPSRGKELLRHRGQAGVTPRQITH